ncbi:E3 ubiquitin-protein ligase RGLG2-like [Andrographis paniculata]|uniref:E3 ubiquitin-protein ligase RGLG2-like n=1 Tax=Andrographis paniculata TaxID=175694 RepID=UPI0021E71A6B|nr:E3 ubiquitin-protein ligase RGLG2-like [Andrographis paniculata]XP_051136792.1 E3 ubiquitin-protein ligase RGLG2-like [Andrographis paniculata]XP_051136794.1 E3 ubiquitin-protein ligase RGLG2-like [Andrographis paniculata]XP_051136795.1 E3 ubiquitin-protein ligase RGLG2-like [Andrographis paniculata]XP_051136796.1 E3 ubiquitin-protein ligase RGLG2-like [Andrographis paniculata]
MGNKISKKSISGRYSSYASSSNWNHTAYPQSSYPQPSHGYAPQHSMYGGPPPPPESKRRLERKFSRIDDNYNSLDQVTDALARAGLESSNLIVGIDFTKSNEWTGARSFHRRSLHHIGDEQNPYEQAISIIGRTLSKFDEDNLIPCFGFGDASTHDQEVFSFFPDERFCEGFEEVLNRYRDLVPQLRLAGPTSFAPIIEMAMTIVEQSGGQYHVLLIIADGQVTRSVDTNRGQLSPQEKKTVDAIVKASEYPLSIILVGVGDGPWDMMREFDDNIPSRAFDNFQFVNFTEIMSKNMDRARKEAEFALAALMEIPAQYRATLELNILGASRGKDVDRISLPPPLYGAASFSTPKPSRSNSFCPSAPTSSSRDSAPRSSHSGSHTSDNHLCPICITEPKDMAFGCGHQTCCECGQDLVSCPICRMPIETRIKLY